MRIGKKLPIGIQSFEEMRTNGYYYVDKTYFVSKLASEGKYYFLSRPRRFGKSLFLDTLRQAFLGKKKLFEGLYLENNWNWDEFHPVILINFGDGVVEDEKNLEEVMSEILLENAENYGVKLRKRLINYRLKELIVSLYEKYRSKVVVLIDEYDKPILDRIEGEMETVLRIREKLKNFYSVLKGADEYLRFVFITGVSKFSKVSLFSGINQLQDITLNREYATICGYTQKEFEEVFAPELAGLNLGDIRTWYNGYSWLGEPVYNPFDVLLYLSEKVFRPYWFETGTPAFLVKLLISKRFHIPELENLQASEALIGSFDVDFIAPENLLFQTGYLTIKERRVSGAKIFYTLTYPNLEVKVSLNDYILSYLVRNGADKERSIVNLHGILTAGKLDELKSVFEKLFASIPYQWYKDVSGYESFYVSVVYSFFYASGLNVVGEDTTNRGRIDLTVLLPDNCYISGFKVVDIDNSQSKALDQIKQRRYWEKYQERYKNIFIIGVEFSSKERNVVNFEWEKL